MSLELRNLMLLDGSRRDEVVAELDAECMRDGLLLPMPAAFYAARSPHDVALWCFHHGFYGLPTIELIEWLREQIAGEPAIEIGAGHGAIARALGIPATDSKMQDRPDIRALYEGMGQAPISYPADVEALTAMQAVEKYKPRVVVASWVTHRYRDDRHALGGNMFGVDEGKLLRKPSVRRYLFMGNEAVHASKPLLELPHQTFFAPWLYSRTMRAGNVLWTWRNHP